MTENGDERAFEKGDVVEYAEGKRGLVVGLVPAVPDIEDPKMRDHWKELMNRAVMDEFDEISIDGPIPNPQYVVRREPGMTTVFAADELRGPLDNESSEPE